MVEENEHQKWKSSFVSKILNSNYASRIEGGVKGMYYFDWFTLFMIVAVIGFVALVLFSSYQEDKNCARWEKKMVHQKAYTSFIWTGKIMVPIHHSDSNYLQDVCVEAK